MEGIDPEIARFIIMKGRTVACIDRRTAAWHLACVSRLSGVRGQQQIPGCERHRGDGRLRPVASVGDHQLEPADTSPGEGAPKFGPGGQLLGRRYLPLWISDPPSEFWDGCSDRAADPLVSRTNIPDQPPSRGDSINGTRRRPPSRSHSSTGRIGTPSIGMGDSINSRRRLSASFSTYAGDSGNEANRESNKKPLIAGLIESPATNGHLRSNLAHQWL